MSHLRSDPCQVYALCFHPLTTFLVLCFGYRHFVAFLPPVCVHYVDYLAKDLFMPAQNDGLHLIHHRMYATHRQVSAYSREVYLQALEMLGSH